MISAYTVALLTLSVSAHSSRMYAAAYYNFFEPVWYVAAVVAVNFFVAWIFVAIACAAHAKKTAAFLALSACLFFLFKTLRPMFPTVLDLHEKAAIFLAILVISSVISVSLRTILERLCLALAVMGAIWTFTPLVRDMAAARTANASYEVLNGGVAIQRDLKANVVLVLDEFSPEYSDAITEELRNLGLSVSYGEPEKAGKDTTNAIPAMMTGSVFEDVSPCSSSSLCGSNYIDFTSINAASDNVDVVGFWHPYCAISNLRSCYRVEVPYFAAELDLAAIASSLARELPVIRLFARARDSKADKDEQTQQMTRQLIRSSALSAPFWDEGGILYVHYLGPHPTGGGHEMSLETHYKSNLSDAAALTSEIAQKLVSRFGEEFNLVVTSDHPLRSIWCEHPQYQSPTCMNGIAIEGQYVPYITAGLVHKERNLPSELIGFLKAQE
jgi:hypothetical protein